MKVLRDIQLQNTKFRERESHKTPAEKLRKDHQHSILIVDDSPDILNLLTDILTDHGYQVRTASSGHLAMRSVMDEVPDLILMDMELPDMYGYEVCHRLKSDESSSMIPVIFISGLGDIKDKEKAFNAGGVDYITKPFNLAEVLSSIKIHLDLRNYQKQLKEQNIQLNKEITIRTQTEEKLRESEGHLSDIINFLPDATFAIESKGKVIVWNLAMEEMSGVKAENIIGKGNYEYSLPFYGIREPVLIDNIFGTDDNIERKYHFIKKQNDIFLAESDVTLREEDLTIWMKAGPLYDRSGNIVGAIESIRDVTEHRRTEESLRQAEVEYRSIFENAQEGIFRLTLAGRFIMANRAMASMLNYDSPKDMINDINNALSQLYVNPDDYESLKQMIKEYGPIKGFETQLYQRDEKTIWVSLNMRDVSDTDGQVLYYEGTAKEITAEKKADEERKRYIKRLRETLGATVHAMAIVVEMRAPYTAGHQRRVSDLARAIATEMGLSHDMIDGIRIAGIIHDIGKIAVPAELLSKPTKLTEMEVGLIKVHSQAGYEILKEIEFPWPIAEIILQHHERLDGSGYPRV